MTKTVVGLYQDFQTAEKVVRELVDSGLPRQDISLIARDHSQGRQMGAEPRHEDAHAGKSAATGAGAGAVLGGLAGLVVGLAALAIPGVGPIIAAGPLATTLAGAGIGAVAGGLVGALTEAGVPENEANLYAEGVRNGGTLVTARTDEGMADQVVDIMNRFHPIDINNRSQTFAGETAQPISPAGMAEHTTMDRDFASQDSSMTDRQTAQDFDREERNLSDQGETHIPIVEEEMRVGKREVEKGGVRVEKNIVEEPFEETHNLRHESVNVERRPANRPASGADFEAFQDEAFEVTEVDEELVTDKQTNVVEDVVISKEVEERPETVRDTLRRTEVHTENLAQSGQTPNRGGFDFRDHYDLVYGQRGHDYNYYEPSYRYGYDLAGQDRYQGRSWSEIEPDVRRDWDRNHSGQNWEDFKDAIRHAWERTTGSQDMSSGSSDWTPRSTDQGHSTGRSDSNY